MNFFSKNKFLYCSIFFLVLFQTNGISQAFTPKFSACVLTPPAKVYPNVKKIAVLDFKSGNNNEEGIGDGTKIADYLTKVLIEESRGKIDDKTHFSGGTTKIFDVMDRSNILATLKENPQLGDEIDENEAVEIGKILGVDAVILGNCSYTWKDETDLSVYTYEGKTSRTYYRNRELNAEARMSVIDVYTGEFIGSNNGSVTKKASAKASTGYPSVNDVTAPEKLAQDGYRTIAYYLANYLTPTYRTKSFVLKNIKIKEYKQRAKDAREQLKLNNIDPAFQLYNAIYQEDNYNPRVAYNLGVIYEVGGDYKKSNELYEIALQLDSEEELYDQGLVRAKAGLKMLELFESINLNIVPHQFEAGDKKVLLREKVKIKGKRTERKSVFQDPDENSPVVQEVPGGMEFSVIEKTEDWVLLDLKIGGKQGYISRKNVKEGK